MQKLIFSLLLMMQVSIVSAQQQLVTTEWLANNLSNDEIVLIDMSDGTQYQRFHIPGAINLPYNYLVQNTKKRVSISIGQTQLIKLLGQIGISQSSYVIAYDDTGGLHASRLLWELEQLGHPKMALVDGGLVKWIREGRKISFSSPKVTATKYKARKTGLQATASISDVAPGQRNKNTFVLDVRSEEEYTGNPRYPRSGHIPGAKWWEWDQALNIDGGFTIHKQNDLLKTLEKAGLNNKQQPVVVYCRSGHRASHAYFTLRHLGFENVKLYDGSMKEYEQDKTLPLKKGKQP